MNMFPSSSFPLPMHGLCYHLFRLHINYNYLHLSGLTYTHLPLQLNFNSVTESKTYPPILNVPSMFHKFFLHTKNDQLCPYIFICYFINFAGPVAQSV